MPKSGIVTGKMNGENFRWGDNVVRFYIEYPDGKIKKIAKIGQYAEIGVGDTVITSWSLMRGWTIEKMIRIR